MKNPFLPILIVFLTISAVNMVRNDNHEDTLKRVCATLPQPHPDLTHHQWKLIFSAVRKEQQKQVVSSKFYQEYDEILNGIFDLAHSETYLNDK